MSANKDEPHFRRVAICGVGLLGGSLGQALRERGLAAHIVGVGRSAERLAIAREMGAIDSWSLDMERGCAGADLIVLCTPVQVILDQLPRVIVAAARGALVTDVGSAKQSVVRRAAECAREGVHFVGSHPMAGSENSGVDHARANLYQGATVIITPDLDTPAESIKRTRGLWEAVGARVLEIPPLRHDALVAALSHLPHVVAAALVTQLERGLDESPALLKQVAGPGFRSTTRVALGNVPMWLDICSENREALGRSLDALIGILVEVRAAVLNDDRPALERFLAAARRLRLEF